MQNKRERNGCRQASVSERVDKLYFAKNFILISSPSPVPPCLPRRRGNEIFRRFYAVFGKILRHCRNGRGGKHRVSQKSYLIFGKKEQRRSLGDGLTFFVKSSHCAGRCDAGVGLSIQSNILLKTDFFDSLRNGRRQASVFSFVLGKEMVMQVPCPRVLFNLISAL